MYLPTGGLNILGLLLIWGGDRVRRHKYPDSKVMAMKWEGVSVWCSLRCVEARTKPHCEPEAEAGFGSWRAEVRSGDPTQGKWVPQESKQPAQEVYVRKPEFSDRWGKPGRNLELAGAKGRMQLRSRAPPGPGRDGMEAKADESRVQRGWWSWSKTQITYSSVYDSILWVSRLTRFAWVRLANYARTWRTTVYWAVTM